MAQGEPNGDMGRRLRSRRQNLGLTQGALVRRLGMSAKQLEDYESGRVQPSAGMLFKLSRELNVPISFFFANGQGSGGFGGNGRADGEAPLEHSPRPSPSGFDIDGDRDSVWDRRNMRALGSVGPVGPKADDSLGAGELTTLLKAYHALPGFLRAVVRDLAIRLAREHPAASHWDDDRR